jgi:hypothetical protein
VLIEIGSHLAFFLQFSNPKTLPFARFRVMFRKTGLRSASGVEA